MCDKDLRYQRTDLERVLSQHPELNDFGFGVHDERLLERAVRAELLERQREGLLCHLMSGSAGEVTGD